MRKKWKQIATFSAACVVGVGLCAMTETFREEGKQTTAVVSTMETQYSVAQTSKTNEADNSEQLSNTSVNRKTNSPETFQSEKAEKDTMAKTQKTKENVTKETGNDTKTSDANKSSNLWMAEKADNYTEQKNFVTELSNREYTEQEQQIIEKIDESLVKTKLIVNSDELCKEYEKNCTSKIEDFYVLEFDDEMQAAEAKAKIDMLQEDATISYAKRMHVLDTGAEDYEYLSYGPEQIKSDVFVDRILEEKGSVEQLPEVVVGVVDTGVNYKHPFLEGRVIESEYDFVDKDGDSMDENGHGTHVSGIIADTTTENVKVKGYKVLDAYGYGDDPDVAEGILQAVEDEVDVINISLGGYGTSKIINAALDKAMEADIIVAIAAGNESYDVELFSPANYEPALTVAAVNDDEEFSWYSNFGKGIDFCAPGCDINSSVLGDDYEEYSGTSMATPFVCSAAALLRTYDKAISIDGVKATLMNCAKDLGDEGFDIYFGYGQICLENVEMIDILSKPIATVKGGQFKEAFEVELKSKYSIYYTTDGTEPSQENGILYEEPITVDNSMVIKAIAVDASGEKDPSACMVQKYYINNANIESDFVVTEDGVLTDYTGSQMIINIPETVRGIKVVSVEESFTNEEEGYVDEIHIPDSVKHLGFASCAYAKRVYIGKGLESMSDVCFADPEGNSELLSLTISEENQYFKLVNQVLYTKDGKGLLYYPKWKAVTSYEILEGTKYINGTAFDAGNVFLKEIHIPASVENIDKRYDTEANTTTFAGKFIKKFVVDEDNPYYSSDEYGVLYNKDKTILHNYPALAQYEEYIMPDSVQELAKGAFLYAKLKEIQLSPNLQIIREDCFGYVYGMKEITIPNTVYWIEDGAFNGKYIKKIYFEGDSPKRKADAIHVGFDTIGEMIVNSENTTLYYYPEAKGYDELGLDCVMKPLESGQYEDNHVDYAVTDTFTICFDKKSQTIIGYEGTIDYLKIPTKIDDVNVKYIGVEALKQSDVETVVIGNHIQSIGNGAFRDCTKLKNVTIGTGIKEVEAETFEGCEALAEVYLGSNVKTIGQRAFYGAEVLENLTLPNGLKDIEQEAFFNTKISYLYVPDSVQSIGVNACNTSDNEENHKMVVCYEGNVANTRENAYPAQTIVLYQKDAAFLGAQISFAGYELTPLDKTKVNLLVRDNRVGYKKMTQIKAGQSCEFDIATVLETDDVEVEVYVNEEKTDNMVISETYMLDDIMVDIFYADAPEMLSCTPDSVTLQPALYAQYSLDGVNWQSENVFTGLKEQSYTIYRRFVKGNITTQVSEALTVDLSQVDEQTPNVLAYTDKVVLLESYTGYEYSLDKENWQTSSRFENLNGGTTYTFYQRKQGQDEYSKSVEVTTYSKKVSLEVTYGEAYGEYASRLPEGFVFADGDKTTFTMMGQQEIVIGYGYQKDTQQYALKWSMDVDVNKIVPDIETPEQIKMEYGQMLNDVLKYLPVGYSLDGYSDAEELTWYGSRPYRFIYTPQDTEHYQVLKGIQINIVIEEEVPKDNDDGNTGEGDENKGEGNVDDSENAGGNAGEDGKAENTGNDVTKPESDDKGNASNVNNDTNSDKKQVTENKGNDTKQANNVNDTSKKAELQKNKVYTVGKLKYRIKSMSGKKTVQVEGTTKKNVKKLVIPATVKINDVKYKVVEIKAGAFKNLKKLKQVTIGKNVTKIGKKAFYQCKKLTKIVIKSQKITKIQNNAFGKVAKKATIYLPKTKVKKYSAMSGIKTSKCNVK